MVILSTALVEKGASRHMTRLASETREDYVKKLTHLYLQNRNIESIGDGISFCHSLKVLYLYDNKLSKIENLDAATNLTHLYLQRNNIEKIDNLSELINLQKLYLGYNCISVVDGLESLTQLEELYIDNQKLPEGTCLDFNKKCLAALADCLSILNVSGNKLTTLSRLSPLNSLEVLIARDNKIEDTNELCSVLFTLPSLQNVELDENPVCKTPKYREKLIVAVRRLEQLDGKKIEENTRKFLRRLEAGREQRSRVATQKTSVPIIGRQQTSSLPVLNVKQPVCLTVSSPILFPPLRRSSELNRDRTDKGTAKPASATPPRPRFFWRQKSEAVAPPPSAVPLSLNWKLQPSSAGPQKQD